MKLKHACTLAYMVVNYHVQGEITMETDAAITGEQFFIVKGEVNDKPLEIIWSDKNLGDVTVKLGDDSYYTAHNNGEGRLTLNEILYPLSKGFMAGLHYQFLKDMPDSEHA